MINPNQDWMPWMRMIVAAGLLLTSITSVLLLYMYSNQEVDTSLTGILAEAAGEFSVQGTVLNFGPQNFVMTGTAPADYDGDGSIETVQQELIGLVGTTVTVENPNATASGGLDIDGLWKKIKRGDFSWPNEVGHFDVFRINGQEYRNPDMAPPWSGQNEGYATPAAEATPTADVISFQRFSYLRVLTSRVLGGPT
ncbi:hypothetical protein BH23CHL3_BH23CHL3_05960 [soil metagenome]